MAKPKSPLLSFGARGTIGDALTFQKRGQDTIIRQKPVPGDPYSLAQAYQRWDYRDYAYLWTLETEASKQTYRTRASRYHITGFNLWMREYLQDLPDLVARWHLDNISAGSTPDSSKQANDAIVTGAQPIGGRIASAFYFDGLDDKLSHPTLWDTIPSQFTIMAFIKLQPVATPGYIISKRSTLGDLFSLRHRGVGGVLSFDTRVAGTFIYLSSTATLLANTWYHATAIYQAGQKSKLYFNAVEYLAPSASPQIPAGTFGDLTIAARDDGYNSFEGTIDQVILFNRVLDQNEIKRHSERSYPP